ncbi:MAG TPA: hypothetical protein VMD06_12835 [Steroidobacteraceae bacterium]|nr:hypothetical protein [Steroidobacteraceae bacterium]HUN73718.1 hypothetical protein [Steroidobacteraceae bacterium]
MPRFASPGDWDVAAVVADTLSAEALIGLFASEGVPARLQSDTALLGAARQCRILVPRDMIQRARCVLWQTRFSDEELAMLAEQTVGADEALPCDKGGRG